MARRRRTRGKAIRRRNPLVPVVRALRPRVKPSARSYTRKTKHKGAPGDDRPGT